MSSAPEPSAPVAMPGPAPNPAAPSPGVPALPQPVPALLPTPVPAPEVTPSPMPTAGVWELQGSGKPVASVEIIGHPVHQRVAQQLGSLHLCEVITYRDGTHDIVGYFPEGKGAAHSGDPMYPSTTLDGQTRNAYIEEGRAHYQLPILATEHQSLDQFVARQEQSWNASRSAHHPPAYDFAGNDLHNSNSAMVSSVAYAGRPDIAAKLMRDLEPPDRMATLEHDEHLSREGAAMRIALERAGREPSAPGASHELTREQIEGRATPEPLVVVKDQPRIQGRGILESLISISHDAVVGNPGHADMLDAGPGRDGKFFTVMRTEPNGTQYLERKSEPFQQSGPIVAADADRITQSIRGRETFTYKTSDLLYSANDPEAALQILQRAAQNKESVNIQMGTSTLELTTNNLEQARNYELGR